jgi:hypothetical protein
MKILGADFEVVYITERDSSDSGDCHNRFQVIRLQKDAHDEFIMDTLLHEIIEAINTKLNLDLPHNTIYALAASLFAVMSDNNINLTPLLPGGIK